MFTGRLALRYLKEQKRHSVLTICSITAAVMFITMLLILVSSAIETFYNYRYIQTPYHVEINITMEEDDYKGYIENFKKDFTENYGTVTEERHKYREDAPEVVYLYCFYEKPLPIGVRYVRENAREVLINAGFPYGIIDTDIKIHTTRLGDFKPIDDFGRAKMLGAVALLYVGIVLVVIALRLLIDTAFEISSKEREKQFGVLQSIGATPRQITKIITIEGITLSVIGVPIGLLLGISGAYIVFKIVELNKIAEAFVSPDFARQTLEFSINPWFLLLAAVTGFVWVLLSAYGTGRRCIKKSPIQAMNSRGEKVTLPKRRGIIDKLFVKIFGWEGELAARNNRRSPKRFIVSVVSLTVSITLFASVSTAVTIINDYVDRNVSTGPEFSFQPERATMLADQNGEQHIFYEDVGTFSYKAAEERLNESGMFKEPMVYVSVPMTVEGYDQYLDIAYVNKALYDYIFDRFYDEVNVDGVHLDAVEKPMSYEELTKTNSYIIDDTYNNYKLSSGISSDKLTLTKIDLDMVDYIEYIKPEYRDLYEKVTIEGAEPAMRYYQYNNTEDITFNIASVIDNRKYNVDNGHNVGWVLGYDLIGSLDAYENGECFKIDQKLKMSSYYSPISSLICDLKNPDDYGKVEDFFCDNQDVFLGYRDDYAQQRRTKALLSGVNIGSTTLIIMFALVALINMVNVLSTGIINRRSEIASLQSIGMSEKQLNKMTVLECLQYVFISGIVAIVLSEIVIGGSVAIFSVLGYEAVKNILGYNIAGAFLLPVLRVLLSIIPAFAAALIASFIPLYRLRKQSLVEQIRSIE